MKVFLHPKSVETCCDERFCIEVDLPTRPMVGDAIFKTAYRFEEQVEALKKNDFEEYEIACIQYGCKVGELGFDDCYLVYEVIFKPNKNGEFEIHCEMYNGDMEF